MNKNIIYFLKLLTICIIEHTFKKNTHMGISIMKIPEGARRPECIAFKP